MKARITIDLEVRQVEILRDLVDKEKSSGNRKASRNGFVAEAIDRFLAEKGLK